MDITLAIAMHKPYRVPATSIYMPIHVGASLHADVLQNIVQDNTGDNISDLNPYLCELTAQYWMWKNCDSEYKGLVHYRRYFATRNPLKWIQSDRYKRLIPIDELAHLLKKHNIVLPAKRHYYIETVYSHYVHTLHGEQLDAARKALKQLVPDYVPAWDHVMKQRSLHLFNMMIMDKQDFDAYSAWLFPVIFETVKNLDPAQYDAFHARYPGRISEILLNVWIEKNKKRYATLPTTFSESINWPKKISSFLKAKFGKVKYSQSFS